MTDTPEPIVKSAKGLIEDFLAFAGLRAAAALLLVAAATLLEGAGILVMIPALDHVTAATRNGGGWWDRGSHLLFTIVGTESATARLAVLLGLLGSVVALRAAIVYARDRLLAWLQIGFVAALRQRVAALLATADWSRTARLRHTRIAQLFGEDMIRIGTASQALIQASVAIVALAGQSSIALLISPILALPALVLAALGLFGLVRLIDQAHTSGGALIRGNLRLLDLAGQFLGGLKQAVSHNLEREFLDDFITVQNDVRDRQLRFQTQQSRSRLVQSLIAFLVAGVALLIGIAHGMSGAPLVALLLLLARMAGPVTALRQAGQQFALGLPAHQRLAQLATDLALAASPSPARLLPQPAFDGPVRFERLAFRHADAADDVLRTIDLLLEPGSFVALTGSSGVGKTTLVDLLAGLIEPTAGTIRIGPTMLAHATAAAWRDHIAYVGQDPFLLHDTLRANLAWGCIAVDEDDAPRWQALDMVGATGFVRRRPDGLDAIVGERGMLLSGGERQRIALARAILRRSRLMILDEATAALDNDAERALFEALRALPHRPIILLIAHRTTNLDLCDHVYHLDDGRLDMVR